MQELMLQKILQFSQILRSVEQNWYTGEEMNGKQWVNVCLQRMATSRNRCKSLREFCSDSPGIYLYTFVYFVRCSQTYL